MNKSTDGVRIWSNRRNCWWMDGANGYTTEIKRAGIFLRDEAERLLRGSTTSEIREIEAKPDETPSIDKRSLEAHYQQYLKLVKLSEHTMGPIQRIETKRAFYGAAGILLVYFKQKVSTMNEDEAIQTMMILENQVQDFWDGQQINFK